MRARRGGEHGLLLVEAAAREARLHGVRAAVQHDDVLRHCEYAERASARAKKRKIGTDGFRRRGLGWANDRDRRAKIN